MFRVVITRCAWRSVYFMRGLGYCVFYGDPCGKQMIENVSSERLSTLADYYFYLCLIVQLSEPCFSGTTCASLQAYAAASVRSSPSWVMWHMSLVVCQRFGTV